MTDAKPYRHRFPMTIIQHAVWLYHRFPLSYRDVQELLHRRGIVVSHETLREWCIKFGPRFAEDLRHREPRRGSRWYLDEVCTSVDGVRHWLWRAVDEHGFVLDIVLQRHRDTEAAKTFLTRLLGEYDVPEIGVPLLLVGGWFLWTVCRHPPTDDGPAQVVGLLSWNTWAWLLLGVSTGVLRRVRHAKRESWAQSLGVGLLCAVLPSPLLTVTVFRALSGVTDFGPQLPAMLVFWILLLGLLAWGQRLVTVRLALRRGDP